jgi:hypothetical protein
MIEKSLKDKKVYAFIDSQNLNLGVESFITKVAKRK